MGPASNTWTFRQVSRAKSAAISGRRTIMKAVNGGVLRNPCALETSSLPGFPQIPVLTFFKVKSNGFPLLAPAK